MSDKDDQKIAAVLKKIKEEEKALRKILKALENNITTNSQQSEENKSM